MRDCNGAYFAKPVMPSENDPVELVFPAMSAQLTPGETVELGSDGDQSATARTTDWDLGDDDETGPVGVKVWHHRYYISNYALYQVSWYELYDHDGKLTQVGPEGTPLFIYQH